MCSESPCPFIKHNGSYSRTFLDLQLWSLLHPKSYLFTSFYWIFKDFTFNIIPHSISSFLTLCSYKELPKFDFHSPHSQHWESPMAAIFPNPMLFLFSSFLMSQEQTVDTFDHSFLLEMLCSPELPGIVFSSPDPTPATSLSPLCLLPWLFFFSVSRAEGLKALFFALSCSVLQVHWL